MRMSIPLLLLIFMIEVQLFANGGPIASTNILKTGHPEMLTYSSTKIEKENLHIKVGVKFIDVHVQYFLNNEFLYNGDSILYGFPVDYLVPFGSVNDDTQLDFIEMSLDGKVLDVQRLKEFSAKSSKKFSAFGGDKTSKIWFYTHLNLAPKVQQVLEVKYRLRAYGVDWVTSKDSYRKYSDRTFTYDFSPAASWGNGEAKLLNLKLDMSEIMLAQPKINGIELNSDSIGFYSGSFKDFSFKDQSLQIDYKFDLIGHSEDIIENKLDDHCIVKFSSNSKVKWDLLSDTLFNTGYSFAPKTSLIFELNPACGLREFHLINGNYSDSVSYEDYSRIKKLKIEFEKTSYQDEKPIITKKDTIITLPNHPYLALNQSNFSQRADRFQMIEHFFSMSTFKFLKITILETYPGKKYKEVFLTEFFLNGPLMKWHHEE